jgi:hypothetical protein
MFKMETKIILKVLRNRYDEGMGGAWRESIPAVSIGRWPFRC